MRGYFSSFGVEGEKESKVWGELIPVQLRTFANGGQEQVEHGGKKKGPGEIKW